MIFLIGALGAGIGYLVTRRADGDARYSAPIVGGVIVALIFTAMMWIGANAGRFSAGPLRRDTGSAPEKELAPKSTKELVEAQRRQIRCAPSDAEALTEIGTIRCRWLTAESTDPPEVILFSELADAEGKRLSSGRPTGHRSRAARPWSARSSRAVRPRPKGAQSARRSRRIRQQPCPGCCTVNQFHDQHEPLSFPSPQSWRYRDRLPSESACEPSDVAAWLESSLCSRSRCRCWWRSHRRTHTPTPFRADRAEAGLPRGRSRTARPAGGLYALALHQLRTTITMSARSAAR
jgi:hypothetical protein